MFSKITDQQIVKPSENQFGLTQDNIETLRSEFLSIGGIVTALPEPKSVRDKTIIFIPDYTHKSDLHYQRWQMIGGQWFYIGDARKDNPHHESGVLDQYNTDETITISLVDTLYEIASGWTITHHDNMSYNNYSLIVESNAEYLIAWSASIYNAVANKDYEIGVVKNGSIVMSGWAHTKLTVAGNTKSLGSQTILDLKIGDRISLGVICRSSGADVTIAHANLTVTRKGN